MPLDRITITCFEASYLIALLLELLQLVRPRLVHRLIATGFGIAGLFAHTAYLFYQHFSLASTFGTVLFLAWILAVFYIYGSVHHHNVVWGIFVLPLVVGLVGLADWNRASLESGGAWNVEPVQASRFWGIVHGSLLLLAAVGVCVGFLASLMYLLQARRLKTKALPRKGFRLLSLERLEEMNRRALTWAFPLLTAGVLVGAVRMVKQPGEPWTDWRDPRILGTVVLWAVFAILLYLRFGQRMRGRQVALWTIVAFGLLLVTLASAHTSVPGGRP